MCVCVLGYFSKKENKSKRFNYDLMQRWYFTNAQFVSQKS